MVWGCYLNSVILVAGRELSILPSFLMMNEQEPLPKVRNENKSCVLLFHPQPAFSYLLSKFKINTYFGGLHSDGNWHNDKWECFIWQIDQGISPLD